MEDLSRIEVCEKIIKYIKKDLQRITDYSSILNNVFNVFSNIFK